MTSKMVGAHLSGAGRFIDGYHPSIVTDRLAYFQFVQGSLATTLAEKLDAARLPLKNLRDKELDVSTRRNKRNVYEQQIAKFEMSTGNEKKIHELEEFLQRAITEDEPLEKEVRILERKAIKENEKAMWEAIREVRSLFSSRVLDRLTSHCSMERNWQSLLRLLSRSSKCCHRSHLPPPGSTRVHRRQHQ